MNDNIKKILTVLFITINISTLCYAKDEIPAWVTKPPQPDKRNIYFTGIKTGAESIEAGREEAVRDVAKQIAAYIGMKVSTKMISQKSELITRLADEIRLYAKADIMGTTIKEMYYEKNRKEKIYNVYILTQYSINEINKEKRRLNEVIEDYNVKTDRLAGEILIRLKKENIRRIIIGEFKELISQSIFTFSNILKNDLKTKIAAGGIDITDESDTDYLLKGNYRAQGGDVIISVNIINRKTIKNIFAKHLSVYKDALEPGWLKIEKPQETFFSELEKKPEGTEKTGTLSITTEPMGAKIYLDGDYRGKTNVDLRQLPVGPHNISLIKDKHRIYDEVVTIYEDRIYRINTRLESKSGSLSVKTAPKGAEIFINEKYSGLTPKIIDNLEIGEYNLLLKKEDHKDYKEKIVIIFDETNKKIVYLSEADGSLMVNSTPAGAKVYIDLEYTGLAEPLYLEKISSGKHKVNVEMDGYEPWKTSIKINAFKTETVSAELKRMSTGIVKIYSAPGNATVYLNGIEKGSTPLTVKDVMPGEYKLEITKDYEYSWSGAITVNSGETTTVQKQLKKQR
ncbi:MAG: PEGA domain-containing protein [Elusimicrobiota bacterium]